MPIASATLLRDTLFAVKSFLSGNIADPVTRPANQFWIMTSYPQRETTFPIITIKDINSFDQTWLGIQSEAMKHYIDVEVRIWANNIKQKDEIVGSVYHAMRQNRLGTTGFAGSELHDMIMLSSINVDVPNGPKSKIMTYRFLALPGDIT